VHELSLSRAIADTVIEHAAGRPVSRVAVRIGHLRQVVPDSLEFCWDMVTDGTVLAGCRLDIEHVPAVAHCGACGARTQLERPVLVCGTCGGREATLESGEEFLVDSIDVMEVI
jgi:hydrogenase nickel incorporation protein HypA/HybF